MKYFKGPQRFMFSTNDESFPKVLAKDVKNLWYLPEVLKQKTLLGKTIFTVSMWNGHRFIGTVTDVEYQNGFVELTFMRTPYEKDTTWVELKEIISIKAS